MFFRLLIQADRKTDRKAYIQIKKKFSVVFQNILNHDNLSRQFLDSIGYKPSRLTLIKDTNNSEDTLTDNQNIPGDISSKPRTGP